MHNTPALPNRSISPRPSAWVLSCVSLIVLGALFGLIDLCNGLVLELYARDKLERNLRTTSEDDVRREITAIQNARHSASFFGLLDELPAQTTRREQLVELALSLRSALLSEDSSRIKSTELALERDFLTSDRLELPHAEKLVNIQRLLRENFTAHERINNEIQRQNEQRSQLNEEAALLTSRYQLLQGDLNEIFSLNSKLRPRVEDFSFYAQGALAGLPVIYGLPDDLADYVALREELERIGGRVRIEGDNANELFTQKLAQIQSQSVEVEAAHRALTESLRENETTIDTLKVERKVRRERLVNTLASMIIALNS